jgi:hypothetical protein
MTSSCVSAPMASEVVAEIVQKLISTQVQVPAAFATISAATFKSAFIDLPKEIIFLIPEESKRLIVSLRGREEAEGGRTYTLIQVIFMAQLRTYCLDSFQTTTSTLVHQILRQAQGTLKTIDQFLGKSPSPLDNGKKVLTV